MRCMCVVAVSREVQGEEGATKMQPKKNMVAVSEQTVSWMKQHNLPYVITDYQCALGLTCPLADLYSITCHLVYPKLYVEFNQSK